MLNIIIYMLHVMSLLIKMSGGSVYCDKEIMLFSGKGNSSSAWGHVFASSWRRYFMGVESRDFSEVLGTNLQ